MTTAALTNPPEIAKEAIRQLAMRRMAPTPDNYARLYGEVSGALHSAPQTPPPYPQVEQWSEALRDFLRAWDATLPGFTQARKRESLERLLERRSPNATEFHRRFTRLVRSWGKGVEAAPDTRLEVAGPTEQSAQPAMVGGEPVGNGGDEARVLRGLLARALERAVEGSTGCSPDQAAEIAQIAAALRTPGDAKPMAEIAETLGRFWTALDTHGDEQDEIVSGLTLLLQLLISNIAELTTDDRWLKGQIDKLRGLVNAPLTVDTLVDAQKSMREVIAKQGTLRHSLEEARQALKAMLASFVDKLAAMTMNTGDFQGKIEGYVTRIEGTDDLSLLSEIVRDLLSDTRGMHSDIARAHGDLQAARKRAEEYETRVRDLERLLERASGLVCEDPLTSALNRRGLDEAFAKESARCRRSGEPLCVAVLDLDNFKGLNDRLGHQAGDHALVHLVDVVREAVRPTDVLGRYGGEEFVILLPDTTLEVAEAATVRVQRALTRRFFLHNNERLLITFSAGVAQLADAESWDSVLGRADRALYEAKRLGKNRVVRATPPTDSRVHSA